MSKETTHVLPLPTLVGPEHSLPTLDAPPFLALPPGPPVAAALPLERAPSAPSQQASEEDSLTVEQAREMLDSLLRGRAKQLPSGALERQKQRAARAKTRASANHREEGEWVRMKGSKLSRPSPCWRWHDFTTTSAYKVYKTLEKALKPRKRDPEAVPKANRTWECLLEGIPNHMLTLDALAKVVNSDPSCASL